MKGNAKNFISISCFIFCLLLAVEFLMPSAQAQNPNVNVRLNTPAGQVEINRPPPQPIVVVPQPPAQRVVVEKPAPPPPPPPAPAPEAPGGSCHCSLIPVQNSAADFLIFAPVLSLLFLRVIYWGRRSRVKIQ